MTEQKQFVATDEAKGQVKQLRLFAMLAWIIAIAGEIFAILKLIGDDTLTWLIVTIVGILILSVLGSMVVEEKFSNLIRHPKRFVPVLSKTN